MATEKAPADARYYNDEIGCSFCSCAVSVTNRDKTGTPAHDAAISIGWFYLKKLDRYFCPDCQAIAQLLPHALKGGK